MPEFTEADTIRILIATDSHVGYGERDATRKDDSWKSFDEVMRLAKDRDVDMVLLAGDLFHDNNPSRQALYQVMRSLRMNCLGDKPCELEMLSDKTDVFEGAFNHVNYEDPDINVAIPVFSIHGNHDDPTGTGHLASLDILQMGGLVNYYGRTHESDNIEIKPVLLQKGLTKLALYGMSNVRDERLFRTFRDGKVKFFRPSTQGSDWFNIMSVHQNHHAYTETSYLPENFLPEFMDLVVWGHEHECLIEPRLNSEMGFHVMQPGSSVATSLVAGEAVPKHVSLLTVTGRDFTTESIRLKTVRPFVYQDIKLSEDKVAKKLAKKENNRTEITRRLTEIVDELIQQAKDEWLEVQEEDTEGIEIPLPLVRLRVEYTADDGGTYDCENPQRFSNRFVGKVANVNDVVQFHRRKTQGTRKAANGVDMPAESTVTGSLLETIKVERLVKEFLTAQSLTILPQNSFGDAVAQFVDKDDKHAMEMFVTDSLKTQVNHLLKLDDEDEDIDAVLESNKARLEKLFEEGHIKRAKRTKIKPKPATWDSDLDGNWSDEPAAIVRSDDEEEASEDEDDNGHRASKTPAARGRGRGRGRARGAAAGATRKTATKAAPSKSTRGRKSVVEVSEEEEEEEEEEDAIMLDDVEEDEDDESQLFVRDTPPPTRSRRTAVPTTKKPVPSTQRKSTQSKLNFGRGTTASQVSARSSAAPRGASRQASISISDDDDDDDAFEPAPTKGRRAK